MSQFSKECSKVGEDEGYQDHLECPVIDLYWPYDLCSGIKDDYYDHIQRAKAGRPKLVYDQDSYVWVGFILYRTVDKTFDLTYHNVCMDIFDIKIQRSNPREPVESFTDGDGSIMWENRKCGFFKVVADQNLNPGTYKYILSISNINTGEKFVVDKNFITIRSF